MTKPWWLCVDLTEEGTCLLLKALNFLQPQLWSERARGAFFLGVS